MPRALMLDLNILEIIQLSAEIRDNDIVLDEERRGNSARVLKNGVQVINYLNELQARGVIITCHSLASAQQKLSLHKDIVRAAKEKGLTFPKVAATVIPDYSLPGVSPNNPKRGILGNTEIVTLSYTGQQSDDKRSSVRTALSSYLKMPPYEIVVCGANPLTVKAAQDEGYRAYLVSGPDGIGLDMVLNNLIDEIPQISKKVATRKKAKLTQVKKPILLPADSRTERDPFENMFRIYKAGGSVLVGGTAGYLAGSSYAGSAAVVGGVSASVFLAACTVVGAGVLLLLAYLINRYRTGRPGFFPSKLPQENHHSSHGRYVRVKA